ncbi:MAG: 50S ribosomal protein L25/general stress protein Ctc [Alphaproteobacteria bacterium]|nr:50S ribosomal protein L25/general stress protein Ctc [Alphaproteobacteria bacterium]
MSIKLNAEIRARAGKGAARATRRNKKIPAVIYGEKKAPVTIELDGHAWVQLIKTPGLRTKLFEIETGSGKESAMLMDIQYHPVSDAPIHVDFKRIDVTKPVSVTIPIQIINIETSKGIKMGGVLNFAVRKVAIVANVKDIPESIVIDLAELSIGEVVHGSALKLPNGVSLGLRQAELAFAAITGKMAEEADAKKAAPAAAAPAKGAKGAAPAKAAAPAKPAGKK